MKKILMMAVAAAMLFAACGKDEEDNTANGGNGTQHGLDIAGNTVVYDGTTYRVDQVEVDYYHSDLTLASAHSSDTLADGSPRLIVDGLHITSSLWNTTLNLANLDQWEDGTVMSLIFSGALDIAYSAYFNGDKDISGHIGEVDYNHESIFTNATLHVEGNNDGSPFTVTLDGTLKNGKTLQMKLTSPDYHDQVNR